MIEVDHHLQQVEESLPHFHVVFCTVYVEYYLVDKTPFSLCK